MLYWFWGYIPISQCQFTLKDTNEVDWGQIGLHGLSEGGYQYGAICGNYGP